MNFDAVKKVIAETASISEDEITMEANLADDLGIDSLDAVEINMALEEEFHITIPDEELGNFKTVKDIVDYIDANVQ